MREDAEEYRETQQVYGHPTHTEKRNKAIIGECLGFIAVRQAVDLIVLSISHLPDIGSSTGFVNGR